MRSALQHPAVVLDYLHNELSHGRLLEPFTAADLLADTHISQFGIIPKGHNTGKWRLITDLSFPPGRSVNDGINPSLCSLTYTSVDGVTAVVSHLGQGSLLAKVDIVLFQFTLSIARCKRWLGRVRSCRPHASFQASVGAQTLSLTPCTGTSNGWEHAISSTTMLREWSDKRWCYRRDLESLIGTLNHACKVVRSGRAFLRRMLDLYCMTSTTPQWHHPD